ncbi:hypothetical protein R1sor_022787 [Riccia sorocarpa]|uniref:Alpha/beta hydrolase fold-3 domain-containing protein n=1 Tax=Riccia sorocarpa TaxID=122646 RepID=A0ABD3GMN1_9MARC
MAAEPQSLAEVPVRTFPLQMKVFSAANSMLNIILFRKDGTVNRGLLNRLDQKVKATPEPVDGVSAKDVIYDEESKQIVRILSPVTQEGEESKSKLPLIIYFHGGGFVAQDVASKPFDSMARTLAKTCNAVVVSVNYRLAPEFRYPTQYEDCFQAMRWIQSQLKTEGSELSSRVEPSQCFLAGDSAGGNIAHFMMVRAAQNDLSPVCIKGVVLIFPFFGGVERSPYEIKSPYALILSLKASDWFWAAFLPPGSDRDHPACNVFGPNAEDISGLSLPPVLVFTGSADLLQDRQVAYAEKMKEMGKQVKVKYTNFCHAEYVFPEGMKKVTADVAEFMKSLIS